MTLLALAVGIGLAVRSWRTRRTWWPLDQFPRPPLALHGWALATVGLALLGAVAGWAGVAAWLTVLVSGLVLLRWEAIHRDPPIT